jgi:hypothetical protein
MRGRLARIWADNSSEWQPLIPEFRKILFDLYWDMFSSVPVYEMTFAKDFIDWDLLEETVEGRKVGLDPKTL